jgi:hypothetical protein
MVNGGSRVEIKQQQGLIEDGEEGRLLLYSEYALEF